MAATEAEGKAEGMEAHLHATPERSEVEARAVRHVATSQRPSAAAPKRFIRQQVPRDILENPALQAAMAALPKNYSFEIPKTVWRIRQAKAKRVALQFPEGLLMFACAITDILEAFAEVEDCIILGDVTYGACCIDDMNASALGADFLVHYGHSCLVPLDHTRIPCLYVFVDIAIDVPNLVETIQLNFKPEEKLAVAGTIQFATAVQAAKAELLKKGYSSLHVPQAKPLSPGEVLGCTAPVLPGGSVDAIVFVADGRFHLEAIMIANPKIPAYRYDPFTNVLFKEEYDQAGMRRARRNAIENAARTLQGGRQADMVQDSIVKGNSAAPMHWGIVLGTLGRQGNPRVLKHIQGRLQAQKLPYTVFLLSELSPSKLAMLDETISVWVQIACPRLSIDWGEAFSVPLLTPFEAEVALGFVSPWWKSAGSGTNFGVAGVSQSLNNGLSLQEKSHARKSDPDVPGDPKVEANGEIGDNASDELGHYPMDYYARDGGPWNSSYTVGKPGVTVKRPGLRAASVAATSVDAPRQGISLNENAASEV